jgi:hypothetical protein
MSEAIRDYVLIKPFPLLCRDAVNYWWTFY